MMYCVSRHFAAVDNSQIPKAANGAVYKGLAFGVNINGVFLFATNFRTGIAAILFSLTGGRAADFACRTSVASVCSSCRFTTVSW